jgi:predicted transposase/invertase (TIGR01784 family)
MSLKRSKFLDPKSDVVFKKIFGQHPELIRSFLNGILPLPKDQLIETIDYLTPEQSPRIPGMKNTVVDVKCTDQNGHIFIVEMQMTWSPSFIKRFLFGTSKAYVQQLDKGIPYSSLCPVYGLAIVNARFEKDTAEWFHHYRLTNVKDMDKTLEGMELIFLELPKFRPQTGEHRKIGSLWMRFLQEIGNGLETIPDEFKAIPEIARAAELAQESAYTRAELEAYDRYLDAIRVELTVRHDSLEEGKLLGIAEGEQIGITKGEQIGVAKGEIRLLEAKKIIAKNLLALGLDIHIVSESTGLAIADIQ